MTPHEIAEQIVGEVSWNGSEGLCNCPARHRHTTPDKIADCKVIINRETVASVPPGIYCWHAHCKEAPEMVKANERLRSELDRMRPGYKATRLHTATLRVAESHRMAEFILRKQSAEYLPVILERFPWSYHDIAASSPTLVLQKPCEQWRQLLSLFRPDDVLWIGNTFDTGKPEHRSHFRRVADG